MKLNGNIKLGPFDINLHITHSILEPNGLSIKTPADSTAYRRLESGSNPLIGDKINEKKLKEIGKQSSCNDL